MFPIDLESRSREPANMTVRKMFLPTILTVAGFSIGWMSVDRKKDSAITGAAPVSSLPRSSDRVSVADLAESMKKRRIDSQQLGHNPLTENLAGWTDQEIINALNASLTDPEVMLRSGVGNGLATQLWGEWMRRDFDSAIAWFEGLDSITVQLSVIGNIQYLWPPDNMEEGISFVVRHRNLGLDREFTHIFAGAIGERAGQGVEALESLLKMMRRKSGSISVIRFPSRTISTSANWWAVKNSRIFGTREARPCSSVGGASGIVTRLSTGCWRSMA